MRDNLVGQKQSVQKQEVQEEEELDEDIDLEKLEQIIDILLNALEEPDTII